MLALVSSTTGVTVLSIEEDAVHVQLKQDIPLAADASGRVLCHQVVAWCCQVMPCIIHELAWSCMLVVSVPELLIVRACSMLCGILHYAPQRMA